MNQFYEVTAVSADEEELERVAQKYGVKHHHVEMTREISPLQDLKSLWLFYRLCKREKPLIVHSHTPKAGIVGMLGAWFAGVPHRFHTVAGLPLMEATGLKRKVLNFVERLTYAAATKVYPNSSGLCDFIVKEQLGDPSKLKVLGEGSSNGIDTAFFDPHLYSTDQNQELRRDLGLKETDFVFIFVGRLVGDKGINELVTAFSKLQAEPVTERSARTAPLKLLLVGPLETALDPLDSETLQEIAQNPNIISLGYREDVRPCFAAADALAFPSYREGFPNVVLQAGAMGLPAIVTDINGCNEIIHHEENGLIIPPKNAPALAGALRRIATDTELYTHLQKNSRPRIQQNYEQAVVWEALLAEYRNAESHV